MAPLRQFLDTLILEPQGIFFSSHRIIQQNALTERRGVHQSKNRSGREAYRCFSSWSVFARGFPVNSFRRSQTLTNRLVKIWWMYNSRRVVQMSAWTLTLWYVLQDFLADIDDYCLRSRQRGCMQVQSDHRALRMKHHRLRNAVGKLASSMVNASLSGILFDLVRYTYH